MKRKPSNELYDLKELLEDSLLNYQSERYYNMSIPDLQKEADKIGLDISKLFKKNAWKVFSWNYNYNWGGKINKVCLMARGSQIIKNMNI